jgi:DASS family divalent anion:Na+ symporter
MANLGALCWAVVSWATRALPDFVVAMLLGVFWLVGLRLPPSVVLSPFSGPTEWLLLASLVFVAALEKTGLAKRVARFTLKLFPEGQVGQILALVACGILFGPIVPDAIAKITLFGPIALEIGERSGYEPRSKGMAGTTLAMWVGFIPLGSVLFMTGSAVNLAIFGALGERAGEISWMRWLLAAAPLVAFEGLALVLAILRSFKLPRADATERPREASEPPMSLHEKVTAAVLLACVLLWATGGIHRVEAAWVALAGVVVLFLFDVLDRRDFIERVDWALWIYVSFITCIGPVFSALGINKALAAALAPAFASLGSSKILFVGAVVLLVFASRILLANSITPGILIVTILAPAAGAAGIHPFLLVLLSSAAGCLWIMPYMNPMFMALKSATRGRGFDERQAGRLNWVFMASTLAGAILCVPWWRMLGLIS